MGKARKHNHKRRHASGKVTRSVNPNKLKKIFSSAEVKDQWDHKKTAKQNYEALHLVDDVNNDKSIQKHAYGRLAESLGIKLEWVDLPDDKDL
jgi:hypothetical protein